MVGFLKIMDSMMIPEVEDMILMRSAPVGPMTSSVLGGMSSMGHFWEFLNSDSVFGQWMCQRLAGRISNGFHHHHHQYSQWQLLLSSIFQ